MDHTHDPAVGYTLQLGRGHKPRHQHRALATAQAASTHKTDSAHSEESTRAFGRHELVVAPELVVGSLRPL